MNDATSVKESQWRSPEELMEIGFERSPIVMVNEAHYGLRRCIRTRRVGQGLLGTAHERGVRHLAMEALWDRTLVERANETRTLPEVDQGYLAQPEMQEFIQSALDLRWTLIPYEADMVWAKDHFEDLMSEEVTNWREEAQARNLIEQLGQLPEDTKMLVWCGNGHLTKVPVQDWEPMGYQFRRLSRIDPFAIDQIKTVRFPGHMTESWLTPDVVEELRKRDGTAGFLEETRSAHADAYVLSLDNELE